jgi:hypothetical protein
VPSVGIYTHLSTPIPIFINRIQHFWGYYESGSQRLLCVRGVGLLYLFQLPTPNLSCGNSSTNVQREGRTPSGKRSSYSRLAALVNVNQVSPVPRKFKYLKNQIKPAKMNKCPSRDHHPTKPLRCVFYTKWRKTSSRCKWRTCRVDKLRNKNT